MNSFILIEFYKMKVEGRRYTLDFGSQVVSIMGSEVDTLSLFDAQQNELKSPQSSLNPFYKTGYSSIVECLLSVKALRLLVFLVVQTSLSLVESSCQRSVIWINR